MSAGTWPYEIGVGLAGSLRPAEYVEIAVAVETAGFDAITVFGDLMFQPPAMVLQTMAAATSRVRLGVAAYNPWLVHPVEIAGQIAYLDLVSGGRAFCGFVRGAWLDRLGIDQTRSMSAIRDCVEIVSRLLAGDVAGYDGPVHRLASGTHLAYEPLRPRVPLLIGTWSPKLAAYAAQVADEVQAGGSSNPAVVSHLAGLTSSGPGSGPRICLNAVTVVDDDRATALAAARTAAALYFEVIARFDPTVEVDPDRLAAIRAALARDDHAAAGALVPEDVLLRFAFAGTPADVADQAAAVLDAGAYRVEFDTPFGTTPRRGLELLADVVARTRSLL